jgi:hypothetical protein
LRRWGAKAQGRERATQPEWLLRLLLLIVLSACPPVRLSAQSVASGRVLRPETATDSIGISGVRVVLHRVGQLAQGPVDSTVSGPDGRFRFRFRADTAAIYLLSARHRGIEYFSTPVHTNPARPDTAIALVVYDTSSRAPVTLSARHLVVARPGEGGDRDVLDLLVLSNAGRLARVAPDSLGASWVGPLPAGSEGLDVGEGDVSPDAVRRRHDSLVVSAPIAPGEKQLAVQYRLPAGLRDLVLPLGDSGTRVNLLLEEGGARVSGPLTLADSQQIQGRSFHRWTGVAGAGATIRVALPGPPGTPTSWLVALVVLLGAGLAAATWAVARRPRPAQLPVADHAALLDAIARLDARYAGREGDTPSEEWSAYQARRAALKTELEAALAGQGRGR